MGVQVFGDAGGRSRSTKAHWTDYQIIRDYLRGLPGFAERVPRANPSQRNSVNEVNAKLRNGHGAITMTVHPRCSQLIKSFLSTVWDENGSILKDADSYEHATDTARYITHELFPIERSLQHGRVVKPRGR
jgi:hypothetical protein